MNSQGAARDVFLNALDKPPGERASFLNEACGANGSLRAEVEELLREHEQVGDFLQTPVLNPTAGSTLLIPPGTVPVVERAGDRIGRYKLLQIIGEGGCGIVYMAEQEQPVRRRVALKIIKLGMDTKSVIARFEVERQALAMMDHPNIAKVFDGGATETGRPYFVMELVRGVRITEYCDQNNLTTEERLTLFVQVCQAIQHAHQKGVIHRDIKPSNILVTLHDSVAVPKVIDFGIAKATEQRLTDKTLFTEFQSFIGTPAYMSPEQAEMSGLDIDTRSDIYALGVLLYEILTGTTPFDAKELMMLGLEGVRRTIREKEPARPSTRVATMLNADLTATAERRRTEPPKLIHSLRGDLDWIVMKCIEKDRTRRYATANDLMADVQRFLDGDTVLARPPSNVYLLQKFLRRHRRAVAAAAAITVTLLGGITVSTWQAVRATRAEKRQSALRQQAESEKQRAEQQTTAAELNEYVADINLAEQSRLAGNYGRAVQLLEKHRPAPGARDLRGFEWRYLWQLTRGDEHIAFPNQGEPVQAVAISPSGEFLATGSERKLNIWNVRTRALVSSQPRGATALAFLPDGKSLVVAGGDSRGSDMRGPDGPRSSRTVRVFSTNDGLPQFPQWRGGSVRVLSTSDWTIQKMLPKTFEPLSLSIDGRRLAAPSFDGIHVWNTATWEEVALVKNANRPIGLSFDGRLLAAESGQEIIIRDLSGEREPVVLENSTNLFVRLAPRRDRALTFSPDGKWIVIARNQPSERGVYVLSVWDTQSGKEIGVMPTDPEHIEHTGGITSLLFSPDGQMLATASLDQSIRLWNFEQRRHLATFQGNLNEVWNIAFSPDGGSIASGSKDGSVRLWPTRTQPKDELMAGARLPIGFSRDNRTLAAVNRAGNLVFFDMVSGTIEQEIPTVPVDNARETGGPRRGFGSFSLPVAISADLRTLAVGLGDGHVQLWNTETRESTKLKVSQGGVGVIALSPDGRTLVAESWGRLHWWELVQRTNTTTDAEGDRLLFSPDGRTLAVYGRGNEIALWDVMSRSLRTNLVVESPPATRSSSPPASFSPDGHWLAIACEDDAIRLWNVQTAELVGTLTGHKQSVFTVAFSPDGRTLASGSEDSTLRFWNVATRQELLTVQRLGGALRALTFSPDGRFLVAGTSSTLLSGGLRVFRAPSLPEIDLSDPRNNERGENR